MKYLRAAAWVAGGLAAWIGLLCWRVSAESHGTTAPRSADAIIVFGAAEYYGKPSPIFRARLERAAELYREHLAAIVITTGGAADVPQFTEGGVGRTFLESQGVPDWAVIGETQANDTSQSVKRVAAILRTNRMHTCIAVSDGYHLFRIERMLAREGFECQLVARRETHVISATQRWKLRVREAFSYTAWLLHLD